MNSRERRKLDALQHNDAIRYEKWLIDNTMRQERCKLTLKSKVVTPIAAMAMALSVGAFYVK